jgi:putative flippase GtrA
MNLPAGRWRPIAREVATFATIGAASTIAYLALYSLFRIAASPPIANALALVVTAIGNTAANRRWTFDVRGFERLASDHAAGLAAFLVALAISSAGLVALQIVAPTAGRPVELAVLLSANVLATVARFMVLRSWFAARRLEPATRHTDRTAR